MVIYWYVPINWALATIGDSMARSTSFFITAGLRFESRNEGSEMKTPSHEITLAQVRTKANGYRAEATI